MLLSSCKFAAAEAAAVIPAVDAPASTESQMFAQLDRLRQTCRPWFQPIIEVARGRVAGYEALARQVSVDGSAKSIGHLFFSDIIPNTLKLGLDRHIRQEAIDAFVNFPDAGFVAVNISPYWIDLLDDFHLSPTVAMIERAGIDPARVVIEITEIGGDLDKLERVVAEYRAAGMKLAVDDFGVGASQIDRLVRLRPDYIKLDMDLFKQASRGGTEADVLLAIAAIAERTGCEIICEGVETDEEFHFALECGASYVQGWVFQAAAATPVAADRYSRQVNTLKKSYLQRKTQKYLNTVSHNKRVSDKVEALCRHLRSSPCSAADFRHIDGGSLWQLGVRRIYICDVHGEQVSPSYNLDSLHIHADPDFIGYNWSHRPYFPLLHAMQQVQCNHVVVSSAYRDVINGVMCKTYGVFISDNRILLIDVLSEEDILFLPAGF